MADGLAPLATGVVEIRAEGLWAEGLWDDGAAAAVEPVVGVVGVVGFAALLPQPARHKAAASAPDTASRPRPARSVPR
ncbi:hypothetical protein GXW82_13315 [Streptacidiphilus sp. 4-A2]|nr:hypothetical protein [Streptacidiphilus sp. 4-A2]